MSLAEVTQLMEMGFSEAKAKKALSVTGNKGVEPAMEWLLSNPDWDESLENALAESATEQPLASVSGENTTTDSLETDEPAEVKSYKCEDCNALFRTSLEVEFHATKSGHSNFSESTEEKKPLTEEEKKQKLLDLEEKLKQKRKEREEKEKLEQLEKEKTRIRSGKEMGQARKKLEELEMKKLMDERRREKEEERLARQKIKEQIEGDKQARRLKMQGGANKSIEVKEPVKPSQPPVSPGAPKTYNEARIQIRLTNGQTLVQTFNPKEQLSAVRLYIELNRTDGAEPFNLMTTFPRKVFTETDYETPLEVLNLVPSAVIIVQKKAMV